MTESGPDKIDVLPLEIKRQIEQAQAVLAEAFHTSHPLSSLGYNREQTAILISLADFTINAQTGTLRRESTTQPYTHTLTFMAPEGMTWLFLQEQGDFSYISLPEPESQKIFQRDFHATYHPRLFGVKKLQKDDLEAEDLAAHILPNSLKQTFDALSHIPFLARGLRSIIPYKAFYLDPEAKNNLAIYVPSNESSSYILRRVATTEQTPVPFDVWGVRQDTNHEAIAEALERQKQKTPRAGVVFQPRPSFG